MSAASLDLGDSSAAASFESAVERAQGALLDAGLSTPHALVLAGLGAGLLPERLSDGIEAFVPDDPRFGPWAGLPVRQGRLGGLLLWVLDDRGIDAPHDRSRPWLSALPIWVAAAAGARLMLHTSAGAELRAEGGIEPGGLAVAVDHLNLSGLSPLTGLGESRYGPLFPDQTRVHDPALRACLHQASNQRGIPLTEVIVGCTLGPAVETPAEQAWFARAGAQVSVQGLASPVIAAAHAGLGLAALTAVVQSRGERVDLRRILERAERLAPALEDLFLTAAPAITELAVELDEPLLPRMHDES
ncbi:MAG: hypothetical protein AAFZ65_02325 [Planctomycetota bacterium]